MKTPPFAIVLLLAGTVRAQGLPFHEPLNPVSASRSGLYAQPIRAFAPDRWRVAFNVEYGNAIEFDSTARARYLLDAEEMRLSLGVSRDFSARTFGRVDLRAIGSYAGFADGFFVAYHKLIHFHQPERDARPKNQFAYRFELPDGSALTRAPVDLAIGDLRATWGIRYGASLQSVVSLTLPTATGPAGYGRGTLSLSTIHTVNLALSSRVTYEGTVGLGVTPRHGPLAPYQRAVFASGSSGFSLRLWGTQSIFASAFLHSPYYHDTSLASLDRRELTADFGWVSRKSGGREWHIGLTEDLAPGDAGMDLVLSVGRTW